ncbi:hypothetical protein L3X38_031330 [Prunus dulcis]|uniref:Protein kinase domain-containing protein n=1 Tax=Prunus dulcis TaxID=3755 RepID=A0AAD4VD02_PRUDU|nr:hypothetical protein L3X38_031330 [Prunus dulcis]
MASLHTLTRRPLVTGQEANAEAAAYVLPFFSNNGCSFASATAVCPWRTKNRVTVMRISEKEPKRMISYMAERVVGTGSFGIVFQAKCIETGETVTSIATIAYTEATSDSSWDKFVGAVLNSLVFVAVITIVTFVLVLLFYLRCTEFLKIYMGSSSFVVLGLRW